MKPYWNTLLALSLMVGVAVPALAQQAEEAGKKSIGFSDIKPAATLKKTLEKNKQGDSLARFTESFAEAMRAALHETGEFKIIARSDLQKILKEQNLPEGLITNPEQLKARPGRIDKLDYLVAIVITDYKDVFQGVKLPGGQDVIVERRDVEASVSVKLYNTTTGELAEVLTHTAGATDKKTRNAQVGQHGVDDSVVNEAAKNVAAALGNKVLNVAAPAEVLAVTGPQVTFSRGEAGGVEKGQIYNVYARGKILKFRGEVLGREEVHVGTIRVTEVRPRFAMGDLQGPNRGVAEGCVLRLQTDEMKN